MFFYCSSLKSLTVPGGFVKNSKITNSSYYPTLPSQLTHTLEDDGSVIPINEDTKLTVVKKLTTYVTTPTTYTLKFDAGEASGSMLPQKAESGEDVIINRNAFYKIEYTFCGWKDEKNNKTFELNDNNQAIIPAKTYEAGSTITLSPIWEPINTSVTLKNGEFSFSLHGGEKATFNNIPAGTAYQVYEETPDGWVLIEQSNVSGSIEPLEESKATFTNKYQPGITTVNLVGLKTLDGLAAKEDAEGNAFKFELLENDSVIQTKEVKAGGMIQFDTIEYDKAGSHTYTIREVAGTNNVISYDSHEETVIVVVTDDGKGNLHSDVTYDKDGIVFANTTKPGSLEISKVGEGITDANKDTVFSFTVKLYNKNGTPVGDEKYTWYDKSTDEELGQSTASNGAILVSAKAGQTVVLKNLQAGMSYEIEETDIPRGWENTANKNNSGTIEANKSSEAVITNKYTATGTATITAHKLLEGNSLESGAFEFELLDSSNEVISTSVNGPVDIVQEIYDDNNNPVTNEWYGTAPVIFDSIKFTEEGDYTFYVREKSGEDTSIVYDTHVETVNIRVFDNGNGSLGTEVEYDSDGALFTNTMKPGQLVVSKTIENATTAASTVDFQFRLTLKDSHGSDLIGTYHVVKSDGSETTITNEGTVSLKGGETFTVTDLPHGCSYEITELDTSGFELTSSVGETGDITGGEDSEASFTNTYSSSGEIVLSASKNLIGGTLTEGMFQFELMDDNNEVIQTVSNNEDGSITFLPIYFTEADDGKEYVYRIKEVTGTTAGIQYDDHTETVIVTVNDTGLGSLDFDVAYDEDGAVFTNSALVDLTISKVVTGSMGNKDEEFTFYLTLSGDEAPETLSYDKDGETGALTVSSGRYEFTLSHGESITFTGIRKGLQYSITEDDSKYNTTISVYESETTSKTVSGTIETSTTVSYTNNLDLRVPTDSTTESRWALIPVFALPVCLLVVGKKRRKQS